MSMNRIGKSLVLVHTAASIVALSWAAGLFLQFTDWGWKEPRSEVGLRIPSEYDKRAASFKDAVKAVAGTVPLLEPARISLLNAEERFGENHLYYNAELARLHDSTEPAIVVKSVKMAGQVVLDVPRIGKPVLEDAAIEGITKSYVSYSAELKAINENIDKENKEFREWTAKAEKVTILLNARDNNGNKLKNTVGIYDLLEVEKKAQDQAYFEKEYLQPIWVRTLAEAESLTDIRERLQVSLNRLRLGKK